MKVGHRAEDIPDSQVLEVQSAQLSNSEALAHIRRLRQSEQPKSAQHHDRETVLKEVGSMYLGLLVRFIGQIGKDDLFSCSSHLKIKDNVRGQLNVNPVWHFHPRRCIEQGSCSLPRQLSNNPSF